MRLFISTLPLVTMLVLLSLAGCAKQGKGGAAAGKGIELGDNFDQATLVDGASRLLSEIYVDIVTVSGEAARSTSEPRIREDSLRWRIDTVGQLDRVRTLPDPRLKFTALWILVVEKRIELTTGAERERFGDTQKLYTTAVSAMEDKVLALAYDAFPDPTIESLRPHIDQMASSGGFRSLFARGKRTIMPPELSAIISVPLSPIAGLQGVGDTPAAINRFTDTAIEIGHIFENLPERSRWQLDLLLLEAQDSGAIAAALDEFAAARNELAKFNASFSRLPEAMQQTLEQAAKLQPQLGENLNRAESTLKQLEQSSGAARQALADAQLAANSVQAAAHEVRSAAVELKSPEKPATTQGVTTAPTGEAARKKEGIQPTDVETAATQVRLAAAEIRGLVADMNTARAPIIQSSADRASRLIWQVTWSIAALIVFFFAMAAIYRFATRRKR